jgi:hypothetical protein
LRSVLPVLQSPPTKRAKPSNGPASIEPLDSDPAAQLACAAKVPRKLWPKGRSPNPAGRPAGLSADVPSLRKYLVQYWRENPAFIRRKVREAWDQDPIKMFTLYARLNGELAPALADVLADNVTSVNITWALPAMPNRMLDSPINSSASSPSSNSNRGCDARNAIEFDSARSAERIASDATSTERAALAWKMPHEMRSSETAM